MTLGIGKDTSAQSAPHGDYSSLKIHVRPVERHQLPHPHAGPQSG
ncbi:MAG: hypothetical protein V1738_03350 [Patescibacteria group bacterium]